MRNIMTEVKTCHVLSTFEVTNPYNDGAGSLRDAINNANLSGGFSKVVISTTKPIILQNELAVTTNLILTARKMATIQGVSSRLFNVSSAYFRIEGSITLRKGISQGNGGAILMTNPTSQLILQQVVIANCQARSLGGAISTPGRVILLQCVIKGNRAGDQGGGVWAGSGVTGLDTLIVRNRVLNPQFTSGGGGLYLDQGDAVFYGSSISSNTVQYIRAPPILTGSPGVQLAVDIKLSSGGAGGGIVSTNGHIYLVDSHVDYNESFDSAGIKEGLGNVMLIRSTVNHNRSYNAGVGDAGGGGVTITLGTVYLNDSEISHNYTVGMYSGGIVSMFGPVILYHSRMIDNRNKGPGGAIACNFEATIIIEDSILADNQGSSLGGAIVNFSFQKGVVSIKNSRLVGNRLTADQTVRQTIGFFAGYTANHLSKTSSQASFSDAPGGKALAALAPKLLRDMQEVIGQLPQRPDEWEGITGGGAVASLLANSIIIENSILADNVGGDEKSGVCLGGAVFAAGSQEGRLIVNNSKIVNNVSYGLGGGIWSIRPVVMSSTNISGNKALFTTSGTGLGGGLLNRASASLFNVTFEGNKAQQGGGIYNVSPDLQLFTSKVINNKTDDIFSTQPYFKYDTEVGSDGKSDKPEKSEKEELSEESSS
jgi:hypothetical protein